jgi:hypothetical protein
MPCDVFTNTMLLALSDPRDFYSVWNRGLWFEDGLQLIGPRMSRERAAELFRNGMQMVHDIWCLESGQLLEWEEITLKFPLNPEKRPFWRRLVNDFPRDWSCKLRLGPLPLKKGEWAGIYNNDQVQLPSVVFKVPSSSLQITEASWITLARPLDTVFYSVGAQSCTLHREEFLTNFMNQGNDPERHGDNLPPNLGAPSGYVKRVRVIPLLKGKKESKSTTMLFYGPVVDLTFDQLQYCWQDGSSLIQYSAKKGRMFLRAKVARRDLASHKWQGILPANYQFNWKHLWDKTRTRKESMLIWLMWHHGVVVNAWRKMIKNEFRGDCCLCYPQVEETILHRFWSCPSAQRIWDWAISLMNKLRTRRSHPGPWTAFDMEQVIFSDSLPDRFKKFRTIWPLLKGTCLWTIWS